MSDALQPLTELLRLFTAAPRLLNKLHTRQNILPDPAQDDTFDDYEVTAGSDIFISVWNLHRDPKNWDRPHDFDPDRSVAAASWSHPSVGCNCLAIVARPPLAAASNLIKKAPPHFPPQRNFPPPRRFPVDAPMPNEITENFKYLPFGGGKRKCVGDQFALFEAVVGLSMLLRRFNFERAPDAPPVGMTTGECVCVWGGGAGCWCVWCLQNSLKDLKPTWS